MYCIVVVFDCHNSALISLNEVMFLKIFKFHNFYQQRSSSDSMGDKVSPDVDTKIIELCGSDTLLTQYGENPIVELHAPLGEDIQVKQEQPLVTVLLREENDTKVQCIGHFRYGEYREGIPHFSQLISSHSDYLAGNNFTLNEREFVKSILLNLCKKSNSIPVGSYEWENSTFTGDYIIGTIEPSEYWETGKIIYKNSIKYVGSNLDFDESRRDELIKFTINTNNSFAQTIANLNDSDTYIVRKAYLFDVRDRAKELYLQSPLLTQTQAISWALSELSLTQLQISKLRDKTQPTISNHLKIVGKKYLNSKKTVEVFGSIPEHMRETYLLRTNKNIEMEAAEERFRFEKEKSCMRVKCPHCGLDAGRWDGGINNGTWVDEPIEFWIGRKLIRGHQDEIQHTLTVECPECGHTESKRTFELEWVFEHGERGYD